MNRHPENDECKRLQHELRRSFARSVGYAARDARLRSNANRDNLTFKHGLPLQTLPLHFPGKSQQDAFISQGSDDMVINMEWGGFGDRDPSKQSAP